MTIKRNRLINFIIGLLISLYLLTSSILSLIDDINIDLSKSKYVVGKVVFKDIKKIQNFSIRWTNYTRVFYIKLNNSNENFAVHRSSEGYGDLQSIINIGDTIKIYYRNTLAGYNRHVFQIEKN
jgi:hypothetical protein